MSFRDSMDHVASAEGPDADDACGNCGAPCQTAACDLCGAPFCVECSMRYGHAVCPACADDCEPDEYDDDGMTDAEYDAIKAEADAAERRVLIEGDAA